MTTNICGGQHLLSLSSLRTRAFLGAIVPAIFVTVILVSTVFAPLPVRRLIKRCKESFADFLTLSDAEALDAGQKRTVSETTRDSPPMLLGHSVLLSCLSLFQVLAWLGIFGYSLITHADRIGDTIPPFLVAFAWLYAAIRPIAAPSATTPFDLFLLFTLQLTRSVLLFGGALFDHSVCGLPLLTPWGFAGHVMDLVVTMFLLLVVLKMPVGIPSRAEEQDEIGRSVSPEDYTTLWGWMSFRWLLPLIERGSKTTLNESDIWKLSPTMRTRPLYIRFSGLECSTLLSRLWRANSRDIVMDAALTYVGIFFGFAGPFFLKLILDLIDGRENTKEEHALGYIYALLAFLATLCKAEADIQHLWHTRRASIRVKSELTVAIYNKALKRKDLTGIAEADPKKATDNPTKTKAGADVGKIVNLMAADADKISQAVSGAYFLYGSPVEVVVATLFLYQLLGVSAFAGLIVLVIGWPLNSYVSKKSEIIQKGTSAARDRRLSILNELISAVKFVKFFAWEDHWIKRVMDARESEIKWMIKSRFNMVLFSLIWTCAPILVSIAAFLAYIVLGNELTVGTAFTSIVLFNKIKGPLYIIPTWIVNTLQARVALNRIAKFLDEDEVDEQVSVLKRGVMPLDIAEDGLGIISGSFKWNEVEETDDNSKQKSVTSSESLLGEIDAAMSPQNHARKHRFELRDIDVMFPKGELSIVTGPTASGKTALLMALLGEMTQLGGRIILPKALSRIDEHGLMHSISYAAQTPWLQHRSIKNNILFGHPYNEGRYNAVVECCALRPDLEVLEDGDATEIGARGITLSGGQKARVALARAVYAPTEYVLLDDPLSAVDSHTARFLFERLFRGPLMEHRTTVLVTHHIDLMLPGAYYLVHMVDGRIDTQGTVMDLRARRVLDGMTHKETAESHEGEDAWETKMTDDEEVMTAVEMEGLTEVHKIKSPRKLVEDEQRATGSVKWPIYQTYLKESSYWTWIVIMFLIVLSQALGVTERVWIKIWGDAYGTENMAASMYHMDSFAKSEHEVVVDNSLLLLRTMQKAGAIMSQPEWTSYNWPSAPKHPFFYIGIYAGIALSTGLLRVGGVIVQYTGALRASRVLFDRLLRSVVRATMRWHDVTPQGRMLNRFSKDIETVDTSLAGTLQSLNMSIASFAAAVITIIVVFPLFTVPAAILGFFYRRVMMGYLNLSRDLRRMESNTRSPIFSDFNELLEGIVTVRAFSAERKFLEQFYGKVDLTTRMWYTFWMANRWLSLNLEVLEGTMILVTTLFALWGYVDAGTAGICMTFNASVYWICRFWTALELDLNSIERVVEYLDIPQEPPAIVESNRPPAYWPSSTGPNKDAMIRVENLVIKYAPELPAVLCGVSFILKANERVGLLGRTGSGKSTLATSILRFVDPADGRIIIDGIDISTIGLHDLRSRITFIPQDATLFSGTLRENLDPFNEHDDSECLDVLGRVQLLTDVNAVSQQAFRSASIRDDGEGTIASVSTAVAEINAKRMITLDMQVSPGGSNFSQGQRQLVALARALLRRSSIVVLDEATSSIDFATDAKIQAAIREEFNNSLLLTVAHRLRTVIDYDRLMVLDKGELVDLDTPWNLIRKEDSIFRNMCLKSGMFTELEAAAKTKAERSLQ